LILLRGGEDLISSFLAQNIGYQMTKQNRPVIYMASRTVTEVRSQLRKLDKNPFSFEINENPRIETWMEKVDCGALVIFDSFSYLTMEMELNEFRNTISEIKSRCMKQKNIVIFVIDREMMTSDKETALSHMSNIVIEFKFLERPEGLERFFRIVKWYDGNPLDQNIFFNYSFDRINIDSRSRVI
jgi:KaiC/GvpD/RAD55 family RecA-like ATPase